jgi:hypothetical protein
MPHNMRQGMLRFANRGGERVISRAFRFAIACDEARRAIHLATRADLTQL